MMARIMRTLTNHALTGESDNVRQVIAPLLSEKKNADLLVRSLKENPTAATFEDLPCLLLTPVQHQQFSLTRHPVAVKSRQKRKIARMSLGYVVPYKSLLDYTQKKNLTAHHKRPLGNSGLISMAISHIEREIGGGLFLHWVKDGSDDIPLLAVATNTKSRLMAMGTPERIQALKSALGMEDDPQWLSCRNG
ncbi:hypothetical protein F5887DRAFT_1243438 [Amanita rubescens]|nr:hypothetical protein F5887DRAFT_1243438 [Amanita rubescens]